jgi:hypothetical protein
VIFPAPDEALWVGVLRLVLRVPGSRSLKDRRRVILSLRDRVQSRHHASVSEVGHLDAIDRAVVAVGVVGHDSRTVQARLDTIFADIEATADALVEERSTELLQMGEHFGRRL